jgi:Zn-finger nucleic acid-binding protein
MHWVRVGEVDLLECAECDGTWIEAAAFEELCTRRDRQAALAERRPVDSPRPRIAASAPVRYRPCPQCNRLMNRQNFGRLSGTIVDSCREHGTFLDRGELHEVVRFILAGGFDRMRKADIERLKEEQQRLRELVLHLSRSRGE